MGCSQPGPAVTVTVPAYVSKEDIINQIFKTQRLTGSIYPDKQYVGVWVGCGGENCYTYDEFLDRYGGYSYPLPPLPDTTPIPQQLRVGGIFEQLLIKEYLRQPMTDSEIGQLAELKAMWYDTFGTCPWVVSCGYYTK
jgi:hypothetical protein